MNKLLLICSLFCEYHWIQFARGMGIFAEMKELVNAINEVVVNSRDAIREASALADKVKNVLIVLGGMYLVYKLLNALEVINAIQGPENNHDEMQEAVARLSHVLRKMHR